MPRPSRTATPTASGPTAIDGPASLRAAIARGTGLDPDRKDANSVPPGHVMPFIDDRVARMVMCDACAAMDRVRAEADDAWGGGVVRASVVAAVAGMHPGQVDDDHRRIAMAAAVLGMARCGNDANLDESGTATEADGAWTRLARGLAAVMPPSDLLVTAVFGGIAHHWHDQTHLSQRYRDDRVLATVADACGTRDDRLVPLLQAVADGRMDVVDQLVAGRCGLRPLTGPPDSARAFATHHNGPRCDPKMVLDVVGWSAIGAATAWWPGATDLIRGLPTRTWMGAARFQAALMSLPPDRRAEHAGDLVAAVSTEHDPRRPLTRDRAAAVLRSWAEDGGIPDPDGRIRDTLAMAIAGAPQAGGTREETRFLTFQSDIQWNRDLVTVVGHLCGVAPKAIADVRTSFTGNQNAPANVVGLLRLKKPSVDAWLRALPDAAKQAIAARVVDHPESMRMLARISKS